MTRTPDPKRAYDYPTPPDDVWLIWWSNDRKWPDARRSTRYLSHRQQDAMYGYALLSSNSGDAATFVTEAAARDWLSGEEAKRGRAYHDVQVTTVADLKIARGYAPMAGAHGETEGEPHEN